MNSQSKTLMSESVIYGCSESVVETVETTADAFWIVIGEEDLSNDETACSEALVQRGYEPRISVRRGGRLLRALSEPP